MTNPPLAPLGFRPAGLPHLATHQTGNAMPMQIRVGFEMAYDCPAPTPMILALSIHHSRAADLLRPDILVTNPPVPVTAYHDMFGNWCSRIVAPQGRFHLQADALVLDSGMSDIVAPWVMQTPVEHLPESALTYLLGSRYCETDQLSETAWQLFGSWPHRLGTGAGNL